MASRAITPSGRENTFVKAQRKLPALPVQVYLLAEDDPYIAFLSLRTYSNLIKASDSEIGPPLSKSPRSPHIAVPIASPSTCPTLVSDSSIFGDVPAPPSGRLPRIHPTAPASSIATHLADDSYHVQDSTPLAAVAGSWPTPSPSVLTGKIIKAGDEDLRIFLSIREILSENPEYAEHVIRAVKALPEEKLNIFIGREGDRRPVSVPSDNGTGTDASSGQTPNSNRLGHSSNSSSEQSNKRKTSPDRNGKGIDKESSGGGSGSGSGGGSGDTSSPGHRDKKQRKLERRYPCPYGLVFGNTLTSHPSFGSCRLPGSSRSRSDLRKHLKKRHSPESEAYDSHSTAQALYYMTQQQWTDVQGTFDAACRKHFDQESDKWFQNELKCCLAVWDIIFPVSRFRSLTRPTSPFYPDERRQSSLLERAQVLFEAIGFARASMAVQNQLVASVEDYVPSPDEYRTIMADAFAVVAKMEPGISERVLNTPVGDIQNIVSRTFGPAGRQVTRSVTPDIGDPIVTRAAVPKPHLSTAPRPDHALAKATSAAVPAPVMTLTFPLVDAVTEVCLRVSRPSPAPGQPTSEVQVTIPQSALFQSFKPSAIAPSESMQSSIGSVQAESKPHPNPRAPRPPPPGLPHKDIAEPPVDLTFIDEELFLMDEELLYLKDAT
ncbi:hypothetical protein G7Z17_g7161 [Cylindrodendrum hubeiense]|uniref:Uncharacterized protein n=1 Tax=Cylindrodendrum hubeiense TaxID=595255 RepID=A0A9P5LA58_9HYPO|nr:hypothetical protein G7Z17_g7161 [Cylindrodendrum hubeiense]